MTQNESPAAPSAQRVRRNQLFKTLWLWVGCAAFFFIIVVDGSAQSTVEELTSQARRGDAAAQNALGGLYLRGQSNGAPDYITAARWFQLAADQGYAEAQYYLGTLYRDGQGLQRSRSAAQRWFEAAANQDFEYAQIALATLYSSGDGGTPDYLRAYMWLVIATSKSRDGSVVAARDKLASKLTPDQIAEAQRMAREWAPQPKVNTAPRPEPVEAVPAAEPPQQPSASEFASEPSQNGGANVPGLQPKSASSGVLDPEARSGRAESPVAEPARRSSTAAEPENSAGDKPSPASMPPIGGAMVGFIVLGGVLWLANRGGPALNRSKVIGVLLLFVLTGWPIWKPELTDPGFDLAGFVRWFTAIWIGVFALDVFMLWLRSQPRKIKSGGFEAVDEGVPHARFTWTKNGGFVVLLRNRSGHGWAGFVMSFGLLGGFVLCLAQVVFGGSLTTALKLVVLACAAAYPFIQRFPTRIEVTPDVIMIDRTKLTRSLFGTFIGSTRLGYSYGGNNSVFGGEWKLKEGIEIASALNQLVRAIPRGGTVHQPAPEQLRNVRPTDF